MTRTASRGLFRTFSGGFGDVKAGEQVDHWLAAAHLIDGPSAMQPTP